MSKVVAGTSTSTPEDVLKPKKPARVYDANELELLQSRQEIGRLRRELEAARGKRKPGYRTASGNHRTQVLHPVDPARRVSITASSQTKMVERANFVRELGRDVQLGIKSRVEVLRILEHVEGRGPGATAQHATVHDVWHAWSATTSTEFQAKTKSVWKHNVAPFFERGKEEWWHLDETRMRAWCKALEKKDYAPKTIRAAAAYLAAAFNLAARTKTIDGVPWGSWSPPRAEIRKPRESARSIEEIVRLVVLTRRRDALLRARGRFADLTARVVVATFCGLRNGELGGLGWDDVDFDRGTITIRHQASDAWRRLHPDWSRPLKPVKGKRARTMLLHLDALALLIEQKTELAARGWYRKDGPVFPAARGAWRTHAATIKPERFQALAVEAGLPNADRWVTHSLRHSAATLEGLGGADLRSIQKRTGHASLEVLEGYLHARGRDLACSAIPRLPRAADREQVPVPTSEKRETARCAVEPDGIAMTLSRCRDCERLTRERAELANRPGLADGRPRAESQRGEAKGFGSVQ